MKIKEKKQFLVWSEEGADEPGDGWWQMYDSLEDAVSENGDGTEVWTMLPTKLGTYKREVSMVKVRKKIKAKKRA